MTISDTTTGTASLDLSEIALQLEASLHRRVLIRPTGFGRAVDALSVSPLRVPVQERGAEVALILIDQDGRPPLTADEFEAVDAASALVRSALRRRGFSPGDRESLLGDLLDADESVRRDAYSRALQQRWVHRDGSTVVRAVLIDATVTDIDRIAFGRHLGHLRPAPAYLVALEGGAILLVGPTTDADFDEELRREAERRRMRILGIGSASPAAGATDLRGAADEATIAASLAAALPQFHPSVDASELGLWRLLASTSAGPEALRTISPAADVLYSQPDDSQRLTIETYLDVGANVVAACRILFLHRTTLYYRLERMPSVVKDALDDGVKRSSLHLALKLIRLWESTGRLRPRLPST
ncbi:helix-turn-helix domain-containing protein [Microbacterium sp. NPDC089320]|uniref:PucR family transcriptional regulator n=1 Tax=Microbacterium sp. NPDC089320 TaxID=3155182 RepID=UPI00343DA8E8